MEKVSAEEIFLFTNFAEKLDEFKSRKAVKFFFNISVENKRIQI